MLFVEFSVSNRDGGAEKIEGSQTWTGEGFKKKKDTLKNKTQTFLFFYQLIVLQEPGGRKTAKKGDKNNQSADFSALTGTITFLRCLTQTQHKNMPCSFRKPCFVMSACLLNNTAFRVSTH